MYLPMTLTSSLIAQESLSGSDLLALLTCVGLATWRVTYMLQNESGPWDLLIRARERVGVTHNEDGEPETHVHTWTYCLYCFSVWVAIILACLPVLFSIPFALSTVAILVDRLRQPWQ